MSARDGGPAFPVVQTTHEGSRGEYTMNVESVGGMSLRQYFAIRCPFNLIFSSENAPKTITPELLAGIAYEFADAMLAREAQS